MKDEIRELKSEIVALTAELTEQKKTYRCFNCGFATSDEKAAEAHFGDSEGDISICVEWHNFSEDERLKVYQEITEELTRERNENVALTAENKQQAEEIRVLRRALCDYNPDHSALRDEEEGRDEIPKKDRKMP